MWEVGWEPSSQSTNLNTIANTNTSTYKYKLVLNMWEVLFENILSTCFFKKTETELN